MARYAVVNGAEILAIVNTNTPETWDPTPYQSPGNPVAILVPDPNSLAVVGGYYDSNGFHPPAPPSLEVQVAALNALTNSLPTPAMASATPLDPGTAAVGVATKAAREDHRHNLPGWAVNTPTRVLNSAAWQPSTTKWTLVLYTVSISVVTTIGGGQDGKIELMSDSASTPTTVRSTARARQVATLAVTLQLDQNSTQQIVFLVPPAHYVRLVSTQTTGAPTMSVLNSVEIVFG